MNHSCAYLGVVATLTLAGCSLENPLFELASAADATRGGEPTGNPLTSTTRPETGGSGTDVTTTSSQTVTSVDPETGGTSSSGSGGPSSESESDSGAVSCSNGMLDSDLEKCDDGNQIDGDDCTNMCTLPVCGDGSLHDDEECDDGNNLPDDGCNPDCTKGVNLCGNGFLDANEQCDDGNQVADDGCSNLCQLPVCGDALLQEGEECDKGPLNGPMADCLSGCKLNVCGDGDHGPAEQCDGGPDNGTAQGECNEECSGLIPFETLKIMVLAKDIMPVLKGDLSGNPGIVGGDALCANSFGPGYQILASDGVNRIASATANKGDGGQKGWVLVPHRAYANKSGDVVFITGKERLLGVRKQQPVMLKNAIGINLLVWTGLGPGWVSSTDNCTKWTTSSGGIGGSSGRADKLDGSVISLAVSSCSNELAIYCVEQPQ